MFLKRGIVKRGYSEKSTLARMLIYSQRIISLQPTVTQLKSSYNEDLSGTYQSRLHAQEGLKVHFGDNLG